MTHPTFTDISKWGKIAYASTGGTRAKKIYTHPKDDAQYFFKGSKKLPDNTFKYPSEFWSEIASSKIGQMLDFRMLDYNIAYDVNDEQQIGCLSKSMIHHSENNLAEGVAYLRGFDPSYNPKIHEEQYTLDFIIKTLKYFKLDQALPQIIDMMVFDACIGNSDRHQENWGFITYYKEAIDLFEEQINEMPGFFKRNTLRIVKWFLKKQAENESLSPSRISSESGIVPTLFSPIYDSGCSLGRENTEERITNLLNDSQMFESYIGNRGKSEIRWHVGGKPSHFNLLENIKINYPVDFQKVRNRIEDNYSVDDISDLVENIDINLPDELAKYKLVDYRKELMIKIVTLRIENILQL